jgi:hypothetical protein
MKSFKDMKWVKWILGTVGAVIAGGAIMMGGVIIGYPAISQLVGLAVAQSSTLWNNVIDAAKGDSQTSGILGTSSYLWNGLTFDRLKGTGGSANVNLIGTITPADGYANPTTASQVWNLNGVFNNTTWDRMRSVVGDGQAVTGLTAVGDMVFNNSTFDRIRGISGANNTATTSTGALQVVPLSTWRVTNSANAGTPSASKASGGGSVRHVATCVSLSVGAAGTAQPVVQVNLRDGGTGAGTIIRSWQLAAPINSSATVDLCGLNEAGTAATAMTLEFAAATAAATQASVTVSGYSTP